MKTVITNGLVYRNETKALEALDILCKDGIIADIMPRGELDARGCEIIDASGMAVYPGLVDVHTHGRVGYDFTTAPAESFSQIARSYAESGVTTVMPTLASAPYEKMLTQAKLINEFCPSDGEASFCGVHFEGRYLNPKKKGAHAAELLAPLNAAELDNDILKELKAFHISAAFELDEGGVFAEKAREIGATLAWGHTEATYKDGLKSTAYGITAYAHLYNAMPPLHHRGGGIAAYALNNEGTAEIICDGIHISHEMVKLAYKAKGARDIALISDSMEATGAPDGEYSIAGNPVTVKNGQARLHDGTLAGSTLTLDKAVELYREFCGISREEAILSATEAPATEVGIFDTCGSIDVGKRADMLFVLADNEKFEIENVILRGKKIKSETRRTL